MSPGDRKDVVVDGCSVGGLSVVGLVVVVDGCCAAIVVVALSVVSSEYAVTIT